MVTVGHRYIENNSSKTLPATKLYRSGMIFLFRKAWDRIKAMILYHHLTHTKEMYFSSKDVKVVETWDSEAWCRAWPDGIPPLKASSLIKLLTEGEQQVIFREYMRLKPQVEGLESEIS
jgi:hypothetical protein